jgi:hypothetical protein
MSAKECVRRYLQYKKDCKQMQDYIDKYHSLSIDKSPVSENFSILSDQQLQSYRTETIRAFIRCKRCIEGRLWVMDYCYDDRDQNHIIPIDIAKQNLVLIQEHLYYIYEEQQRRYTANSIHDDESTSSMIETEKPSKASKKKRQKQKQKKRQLFDPTTLLGFDVIEEQIKNEQVKTSQILGNDDEFIWISNQFKSKVGKRPHIEKLLDMVFILRFKLTEEGLTPDYLWQKLRTDSEYISDAILMVESDPKHYVANKLNDLMPRASTLEEKRERIGLVNIITNYLILRLPIGIEYALGCALFLRNELAKSYPPRSSPTQKDILAVYTRIRESNLATLDMSAEEIKFTIDTRIVPILRTYGTTSNQDFVIFYLNLNDQKRNHLFGLNNLILEQWKIQLRDKAISQFLGDTGHQDF